MQKIIINQFRSYIDKKEVSYLKLAYVFMVMKLQYKTIMTWAQTHHLHIEIVL